MCELPACSWKQFIRPVRVVLALAAVAFAAVGVFTHGAAGLAMIGISGALALALVVLPAVSQVEFGFPAGVKIVAAVHHREENLHRAFDEDKPALHLWAVLMCDDPAAATELLEAAFSTAVQKWRGPTDAALRLYVLCSFVHLLTAHDVWVHPRSSAPHPGVDNVLALLPLQTRIAVVLRNFANLPIAEIAGITGRTTDELARDLAHATRYLNRCPRNGRGQC